MKRRKPFVAMGACLVILALVAVSAGMAQTPDGSNPLLPIWRAIVYLQAQIRMHVADPVAHHPPNDAHTYSRQTIPLMSTSMTVAQLFVPAGSYEVHGYVFVQNLAAGPFNAAILCSLVNSEGTSFDFGALSLQPFLSGNNISGGTLSLTSAATLGSSGSIMMDCYNNTGLPESTAEINIVRLTAVKVASLTDQ